MTPLETEADLAGLIAGARDPLAIRGGGTRGLRPQGEALETSGLTGIDLYEPGALTLVAAAGTPVGDLQRLLATENQRLAFEPMDHRPLLGTTGEPTIGGVVAGNISGPRRVQAGACRDFLLGVRYIDGTGTVIKNGGRVMKNVTGYDLVKLMAGSWGTLGVLTQVSLKVLPRAETQATVVVSDTRLAGAVRAMSAALGSPYEVSGAAFDPAADSVFIRIEGFVDSVAYRLGRLTDLLSGHGTVTAIEDTDASDTLWKRIRDVEPFADAPGDVWRLSVKPSDAPEICGRLDAEGVLLDWGGGLIWARVPSATDLRGRLGAFGGHATLVRADAETRAALGMFQPESAPIQDISARLRARFDPRGIFNRGLMGRT